MEKTKNIVVDEELQDLIIGIDNVDDIFDTDILDKIHPKEEEWKKDMHFSLPIDTYQIQINGKNTETPIASIIIRSHSIEVPLEGSNNKTITRPKCLYTVHFFDENYEKDLPSDTQESFPKITKSEYKAALIEAGIMDKSGNMIPPGRNIKPGSNILASIKNIPFELGKFFKKKNFAFEITKYVDWRKYPIYIDALRREEKIAVRYQHDVPELTYLISKNQKLGLEFIGQR